MLKIIFILSFIGICETAYLIKKRLAAEKPICPMGGCEKVLTSKYSKTFGIPNDILGLIFYSAVAVLSVFLFCGFEPVGLWGLALIILVGIGSLTSLFFTYLQWRVIKSWCLWCLGSAFTTWLMFLIICFQLFKYAY